MEGGRACSDVFTQLFRSIRNVPLHAASVQWYFSDGAKKHGEWLSVQWYILFAITWWTILQSNDKDLLGCYINMINLVLIIFNVPLVFCSRLDLNECDLPDSCDSSVSRCNNIDGSFTCHCLPGFEMNSSSVCVGELAAILIVESRLISYLLLRL